MKTLKTKTVNMVVCWNNLRRIPPKAFPNIEEIDKTFSILQLLENEIADFAKTIRETDEIIKKLSFSESEEERKIIIEKRDAMIKELNKLEEKYSDKRIEIEFENDEFNTFFQQFERWGKEWFVNIEEFLKFRQDMNETNSQSSDKKKK